MAFIRRTSDIKQHHAITKILLDVPNGGTIAISELTQNTLAEGLPVSLGADGLYHVVKTATISTSADSDATTYVVEKGHNLKVGDVVMFKTGGKAYAITAIATNSTNSTNDDITIGTTLGAAKAGDVLIEASKAGASGSDFKYKPTGLLAYSIDVKPNATIGIMVAGQIYQSKCQNLGAVAGALPLIHVLN